MSESGRNVKIEHECPKCGADEITGWMEFRAGAAPRVVSFKCSTEDCDWNVLGSYEDPPVPTIDGKV